MSKKIAIINDFSGFGRCSISVILPIVSHLGVQGCALPTAIFSNHTGFPSFWHEDETRNMPSYIAEWKKLDLRFDAIMSGFLGSARQIGIVEDFFRSFHKRGTRYVVDPVMGDNGHFYPTITPRLAKDLKRLVAYADILTPNITEACLLTGTPYQQVWRRSELDEIAQKLHDLGAKDLVITGIRIGENWIGNAVYPHGGNLTMQRQHLVNQMRSGTGDVFAAVIGADVVNGVPFAKSVKRASRFVAQCLIETSKSNEPTTNGVDFELVLPRLSKGVRGR